MSGAAPQDSPLGPPPGDLYATTWAYRAQVDQLTSQSAALMEAYYLSTFNSLTQQLDALAVKIFDAQQRGEHVSPSWLHQEAQLEAILLQIAQEIDKFAKAAQAATANGQQSAADLGVNSAVAQLGTFPPPPLPEGTVGQQWGVPSQAALEALAGASAPGSPLADLFEQMGPQVADLIRQLLFEGLARGEHPLEVAADISGQVNDLTLSRAQTIARTEMQRAYRNASLMTYQENSDVVGGWQWLAGLSVNTCAFCWSMDGTTHGLDETMDSHVSCACSMAPLVPDNLDLTGDGGDGSAAPPEEDALPIDTPASEQSVSPLGPSGPERFAELSPEQQKAILGPSKFALYANGDLALEDLRAFSHDPAWGRSGYEPSLKQLGFTADDVAAAREALAKANKTLATVDAMSQGEVLQQTGAGLPEQAPPVVEQPVVSEPPVIEPPQEAPTHADGLDSQAQALREQADQMLRETPYASQPYSLYRQAAELQAQADEARGGVGAIIESEREIKRGGVFKDPIDNVNRVFDREVSRDELAGITGASTGDRVNIMPGTHGSSSFYYEVKALDGREMSGEFYRTKSGQIILKYDTVITPREERGVSSGADILRSLDNLREMGVSKLTATAEGDAATFNAAEGSALSTDFRGYYTWARLGFTGSIPAEVLPAAREQFGSKIKTVQDLMQQPGGPQWWKANGTSWQATFDFSDGSYSRSVLDPMVQRLQARKSRSE